MRRPELRDLLERLVVDRGFLAAFQSDPEGTLEAFDLTDRQRGLLRDGGDGARVLLAEAFAKSPAQDPSPGAGQDEPPPPSPGTAGFAGPGPEGQIRLLARLMFSVAGTDAGQAQLHYAAGLSMLPPDADPAALPTPEADPSLLPGDRLNDALFELKVVPHLALNPAGGFQVTCLQATLPVTGKPVAPQMAADTQPAPMEPLLAAVRRASPADRGAALQALVAAIDGEADHG